MEKEGKIIKEEEDILQKEENIIQIKNLTKIYTMGQEKISALDDVSIDIKRGKI